MVKTGDIYGGNYLSAAMIRKENLIGKPLTIKGSSVETFRNDTTKIVLDLEEIDRQLVLNKTNATSISDVFGDDTDTWAGRKLILQVTKRMWQGSLVDAIEVIPQRN